MNNQASPKKPGKQQEKNIAADKVNHNVQYTSIAQEDVIFLMSTVNNMQHEDVLVQGQISPAEAWLCTAAHCIVIVGKVSERCPIRLESEEGVGCGDSPSQMVHSTHPLSTELLAAQDRDNEHTHTHTHTHTPLLITTFMCRWPVAPMQGRGEILGLIVLDDMLGPVAKC